MTSTNKTTTQNKNVRTTKKANRSTDKGFEQKAAGV
jgi:hypothetical protein